MQIPRDGIYTFSIRVNDKCTFYIDDQPFLSGGYRTIALRKGKYRVKEKYFQLGANKFNVVRWKGPGMSEEEIPAEALFYLER